MRMRRNIIVTVATLAFIIALCISSCKAGRPLVQLQGEEEEKHKRNSVVIESLPRGPVRPSGPSGCTYIPGRGGPKCPLIGNKIAGAAALNNHDRSGRLQFLNVEVDASRAKQQQ
ncbi:hypothetical protein Scep_029811 [Stephania cephalantha]|uniref:Uncharacterized protein n=1 Tax=Stephania cephalantha TaxID=152367 RepID=A0AAP0HI06_9MAGN